MNKKVLTYGLVALGLISIIGTGVVSASEKANDGKSSFHNFSEKIREMKSNFRGKNIEMKAEVFGMTVEELQAELDAGKKFHTIAEEAGLEREDVRTETQEIMKAKVSERLARLVAEGEITQEEADEKLANMGQRHETQSGKRGMRKGCEECKGCTRKMNQ